MTAKDDLLRALEPHEIIEAVVFGEYGWDGFREPSPTPVPTNKRNELLTPEEALGYLEMLPTLFSGYGSPEAYAMYVWTNKNVLWITQYDGSTSLNSVPRNPVKCEPSMPGG